MLDLDVRATGISETQRALEESRRRHLAAFRAAEFIVAGDMLAEIVPTVPRLTGALADSGYVTRTWPVQAGFAARHALVQHETGPHRKYLQRPMSRMSSSVAARIARVLPELERRGATLETAPARFPDRPESVASRGRRRPTVRRR
jgi:hypothetical protein